MTKNKNQACVCFNIEKDKNIDTITINLSPKVIKDLAIMYGNMSIGCDIKIQDSLNIVEQYKFFKSVYDRYEHIRKTKCFKGDDK